MLRTLRWQLTLLYLVAALGLAFLLAAGSYALLRYYFQQSTDLALQYKMATEFRSLGLRLPADLARSEQVWLQNNPRPTPIPTPAATSTPAPTVAKAAPTLATPVPTLVTPVPTRVPTRVPPPPSSSGGEDSSDDEGQVEGELSPIFVVPSHSSGNNTPSPTNAPVANAPLPNPPVPNTPLPTAAAANAAVPTNVPITKIIDAAASSAAARNGADLRTITLENGSRVRLLTYPTGLSSPAVIQVGRALSDQDRVLHQYLTGLFILGLIASLLLALVSWWLAGRSLSPAQKAWDQQQSFVSNASHELRTPLTLIRASADYGLRAHPPEEQAQVLKDVVDEADYMNRLVDDLLLLSRLDAQRLQLEIEIIPVADLLSETVRQMEKLAQEKGVTLALEAAGGNILGDRARVRQVLLILLDNALRFTARGGGIRLGAGPSGKWVEIIVADNGSGIAPEHLPHLFERFYQVRTNASDDSRSNGLGLSIAKALIEAQNGSIRVESAPGKGTRVVLVLPAA